MAEQALRRSTGDIDTDFVILGVLLRRMENASAHIVMNSQGIVEAWNAPAVELFGWTADETRGQLMASLIIPPSLRERHCEGLEKWQTMGTGLVICQELRTTALHKDGHQFSVVVSVQVVQDDTGIRFLGWVRSL